MKWLPVLISAVCLGVFHRLLGVGTEHIAVIAFILACYYAHAKSRQFILDILPLAYFGFIYDLLRAFPKNMASPISVTWPYNLEKFIFGFSQAGQRVTPNEFWGTHTHLFLDVVTAFSYSLHLVVPMGFAVYALWRNRPIAKQFLWGFFLINIMAFLTWIFLPVAPPWYVDQFGLVPANWSIIGNPAGLIRFDQFAGVPYFQEAYARGSWVFGAIPSMHAAFPLLVILFARKIFKRGMIFLYMHMILVWFSAVYLNHHYIVDLLVGGIYALITYCFTRACLTKKDQPIK